MTQKTEPPFVLLCGDAWSTQIERHDPKRHAPLHVLSGLLFNTRREALHQRIHDLEMEREALNREIRRLKRAYGREVRRTLQVPSARVRSLRLTK